VGVGGNSLVLPCSHIHVVSIAYRHGLVAFSVVILSVNSCLSIRNVGAVVSNSKNTDVRVIVFRVDQADSLKVVSVKDVA